MVTWLTVVLKTDLKPISKVSVRGCNLEQLSRCYVKPRLERNLPRLSYSAIFKSGLQIRAVSCLNRAQCSKNRKRGIVLLLEITVYSVRNLLEVNYGGYRA